MSPQSAVALSTIASVDAAPARAPQVLRPRTVRLLELPGADRPLAYAAHYWGATLANLMRRHRLHATCGSDYAAAVNITPHHQEAWQELFEAAPGCPLLYNQSVGTLLYTRVFRDLGLNFRHLLHVQHRTEHVADAEELAAGGEQQLLCELQGVTRLAEGKALVSLRTRIHAGAEQGGALLAVVVDRFMVRRVPMHDWQQLPPADRQQLRELLGLRKRAPEILPGGPRVRRALVILATDQGQRYAAVSGDHNPVHTTPLAARLFGQPRPFVQGLALRNAVMAELHRAGLPLQRLEVTFAAPASLGQTLQWLHQGQRWELVDEDGAVVAFGTAAEQVG